MPIQKGDVVIEVHLPPLVVKWLRADAAKRGLDPSTIIMRELARRYVAESAEPNVRHGKLPEVVGIIVEEDFPPVAAK